MSQATFLQLLADFKCLLVSGLSVCRTSAVGELEGEVDRGAMHAQPATMMGALACPTQGHYRDAVQWVGRIKLREPENKPAYELQETIHLVMASASRHLASRPTDQYVTK